MAPRRSRIHRRDKPIDTTLSLNEVIVLFAAMSILAAVPSVSVMTVSARAAAHGFGHGALVGLGVVAGDVVFILVALLGLSLLADTLGGWFLLVKLAGGAYLIWLGVTLWRAGARSPRADVTGDASRPSSFLSGLLITLGDQKAILFYLGFFPAFVDLTQLTPVDIGLIIGIAIVSVGGVKLMYAYLAERVRTRLGGGARRVINRAAALVLVAVGSFVMAFP